MLQASADYKAWVVELKSRLRSMQLKAAVSVNSALLEFYWELGADIVDREKNRTWGDGFLKQLSQDLMAEFPEMKGFSYRNLRYIKQWHLFYCGENEIWQQPVAKLAPMPLAQIKQIPWGHNLLIISKCQSQAEALYYVENTIQYGWSRNVLTINRLGLRHIRLPMSCRKMCDRGCRALSKSRRNSVNRFAIQTDRQYSVQ
jgi:predicted nuclease of restriction endonuclease-like (RecB) superfamily